MLLPALIVSATCACLLLLLNVSERAYLRRHAASQSRALLAAQVEASAHGPFPGGQDLSPLLAETLAQDIFADPQPEGPRSQGWPAARRGHGGPRPHGQKGQG